MIQRKFVDLHARGSGVGLDVAERDVILTYALQLLEDTGLSARLGFKGGTALRKIYFGSGGRFSEDLDFTALTANEADDVILRMAELLNRNYHGVTFKVSADDIYVREDRRACGALVHYAHEWNPSANFSIDISLREVPILEVQRLPLIEESYFRHLEFAPSPPLTLAFEEIVAEKIRAAFQRVQVRDVYDLSQMGKRPFDRDIVRSLAVLKCWQVGDPFDPASLLEGIRSSAYEWSEVDRLVRRERQPDRMALVQECVDDFHFLLDLNPTEQRIIEDSRRHRRRDLVQAVIEDLHSK